MVGQSAKEIGPEEVAEHATPEDCWMTVWGGVDGEGEGEVLDMAPWASDAEEPGHPGGNALLAPFCGKTVTNWFALAPGHETNDKRGQFRIGAAPALSLIHI